MTANISSLKKYLRFANYLGATQLYLRSNFLLEKPLVKDDVKRRVLGHWGTVPGLNLVYGCSNILVKNFGINAMFIAGPGHGAPAVLANLFLEGTLGEFYPKYKLNKLGIENLIRDFSWPGGFPSHVNPATPGGILEGGELGYSLPTAFGAVLDNPDLVAICVVGDGEAETATLATSWHSNKFLNPKTCGAVLPILHLNNFKISGPTIYGSMENHELLNLFTGYGYDPILVDGQSVEEKLVLAMEKAYKEIREIQHAARENNCVEKPKWPVIILRTPKGWTGPKELNGVQIEGTFRSHGVPLEKPQTDEEEFKVLKEWLESYRISELIERDGTPIREVLDVPPIGDLRMGFNKHANGLISPTIRLPKTDIYEIKINSKRGDKFASSMKSLGLYLRDVIEMNSKTFRLMSPDETESNKLHSIFEATKRGYIWPPPKGSENIGKQGRVMEVLSENLLMGWMQGYVMTGRHAVFISYEAFMMIIASMVDQYSKFIEKAQHVEWRKPLPSLNFVLTSNSWRQDHNGFSHQNPGFISACLNNHSNNVNVFFPPDANSAVVTLDECFKTFNKINVIIAGKTDLPQYLSIDDAKIQGRQGIDVWEWAGNKSEDADVVFAASGDYMTYECLAAVKILRELAPEIKTRFVSVSEITGFGIGDNYNKCNIDTDAFNRIFTADKEIIYAYHGYPEDIKQLVYNHPESHRFHIRGYIEKGTTTTPFDMLVQNECSRYNLAIDAVNFTEIGNPMLKKKGRDHLNYFKALLSKHEIFITEHGYDMPEVTEFTLT